MDAGQPHSREDHRMSCSIEALEGERKIQSGRPIASDLEKEMLSRLATRIEDLRNAPAITVDVGDSETLDGTFAH